MNLAAIQGAVSRYYTETLRAHGATPRGVDWPSAASQALRFERLLGICDGARSFSLNDYGCGYGALADHLAAGGYDVAYCGFDIAPTMVAEAEAHHRDSPRCRFVGDEALLPVADYTLASGVFNIRLDTPDDVWREYVLYTLGALHARSRRGFAFNMLTSYSDADRQRPDLYYADPLFFFDYCQTRFPRSVALLHDYPLYEFTIWVRV